MSDSHLQVRDGKVTAYVGEDAMRAVRAITIASGLKLYVNTGGKMKLTRGAGINFLLLMAQQFTGKRYTRKQAMQAHDDLIAWANEMKAALPVVEG
jgi:hypothetical protein